MKLPTNYLVGKILLVLVAACGIVGMAQAQTLFERNLRLGDQGEDVKRLQVFLNHSGAPVAKTGVGSLGQESISFGQKTQQAVAAFQELHRAKVLSPANIPHGTGNFYTGTREFVNKLLKNATTINTSQNLATSASATSSPSSRPTYVVGGMVTGLTAPVLLREVSGETLRIKPGDQANFVFSRAFASGDRYQVTAIPEVGGHQTCYLSSNSAGTITAASITSIQIQCTSDTVGNPFLNHPGLGGVEQHALGGTVSGLSGTVVLRLATGETVSVTSNGSFAFGSLIARGSSYAVSVQTNPSSPDQTCTVTNGSGVMGAGNITDISVTCVNNTTTLSASVSNLALSIAGIADLPSSGLARMIVITNAGSSAARNVAVSMPTWPSGTISSTTCGDTLAASASCTITITPGDTATSDGASPCTGGTAPVPGVVQVSADNADTVSSNVVVLGYGCIYQQGYLFSIDDSTPATQSIGGTVAAVGNQSDGVVWGSNGAAGTSVSYDIIPGIGETSLASGGTPTFGEFNTYYTSTYSGVQDLLSSSFSLCDGKSDGRCNTANIVSFYNHYQTNYGIGVSPYTPVVAQTPKAYYAAGICDDYDSGTYQDWYLPAICEVTYDIPEVRAETAGCGLESSPLMQTMMKNLFLNGIGGFTAGQGLWSSSEYMYNNPETYAWNAFVWFTPFPGGGDKSDQAQVRCVRSLTE